MRSSGTGQPTIGCARSAPNLAFLTPQTSRARSRVSTCGCRGANAPANVDRDLGRLRQAGDLVRRESRPSWSVTPSGAERIRSLTGNVDPAALSIELAGVPGAELGHVLHTLIPPTLAPAAWVPAI